MGGRFAGTPGGPRVAQRTPTRRATTYDCGPWERVVDSLDPGEARRNWLADAFNAYIRDAEHGSGVAGRPPFSYIDGASGGATFGPGGGPHGCQCVYDHTEVDGTIRRLYFIGGLVYRWDGNNTLTDVTPVGITIDSTAPIFCTSLIGKLIVTDQTNKPWMGTNLASAPITGSTLEWNSAGDAWSAFHVTTRSGKVVFIANALNGVASRETLLWSEEADPTTGYEQSGFTNAWDLTQTATDPLCGILGTNAGLYYWREGSTGEITGEINSTFATTSNADAIDTTVGCTNPATIVKAGDSVFFGDRLGRPHRMQVGGKPEDLSWQCIRTMVASFDSAATEITFARVYAWASAIPDLGLVGFCLQTAGANTGAAPAKNLFIFSAATGAYYGIWQVANKVSGNPVAMSRGGAMRDANGSIRFVVADTTGVIVVQERLASDIPWDEYDGITSGNPLRWILTGPLGYSMDEEKSFTLARASVASADGGVNQRTWSWGLSYRTSVQAEGTPAIATATAPPANTNPYSGDTETHALARAEWGILGTGRYLSARIAMGLDGGGPHLPFQPAIYEFAVDGVIAATGGRFL